MLSWYEFDGVFYVTYQRNEHSEIETLYEGDNEAEQMRIVDDFIDVWA